MDQNNNKGGKIVAGVLLAGIAGYVAGVLTAPKSGQETRQDIRDGANRAVEVAEEKLLALREDLDDLIEIASGKVSSAKGRAKDQLNDAIDTAKDARVKSVEVAKAVKSGEADQPELNRAMKQLKDAKKNLTKYLKS
jgi:gas vesicle protein